MKRLIILIILAFFIVGCSSKNEVRLHNNTVYEKNDKYYNSQRNKEVFTREYKYGKQWKLQEDAYKHTP